MEKGRIASRQRKGRALKGAFKLFQEPDIVFT